MDKIAFIPPTREMRGNAGSALSELGRGNAGSAFHRAANATNPISLATAQKWREWSGKNPVKAIGASFLPAVGGIPNLLDARMNLHEGKYLAAAGNTLSAAIETIPGGFLVSKGLKFLRGGVKAVRAGKGLRAATAAGRAANAGGKAIKGLKFRHTIAPNLMAVGGELFEPGRGPNAEPSIYSQMRSGASPRAATPVGTSLGNYRLAEEAARGLAKPFSKAASAQPTLADLLAAVERDGSLGPAQRIQISASVRAAASGASDSTPLSALMARGFGGLIAAMAAKYFGGGRIGQMAAGAIGFGLTGRSQSASSGKKDPWEGWKMLG